MLKERMRNVAELPEFDTHGAGTPEHKDAENYFIHTISFPPCLAALVLGEKRHL